MRLHEHDLMIFETAIQLILSVGKVDKLGLRGQPWQVDQETADLVWQ